MRFLRLVLIFVAILIAAPSAQAPAVDGTWRAEFIHDPSNPVTGYPFQTVVFRLQMRDNRITGTVEAGTLLPEGTPISNATFDGERFTFEGIGTSLRWPDPDTRERRCCPKWILTGLIQGDVMVLTWVETMTDLPAERRSQPTPMVARRVSTNPNATLTQ